MSPEAVHAELLKLLDTYTKPHECDAIISWIEVTTTI
jgi:hypothetical protein